MNRAELLLPAGVTISVYAGTPNGLTAEGACNAFKVIYVGTTATKYVSCNGGGATYSFADIMGTTLLNLSVSASPMTICILDTTDLTATVGGTLAGSATFQWSATGPGTVTFTPSSTNQTPTASFSTAGSYLITCLAASGTTSKSASLTVTVNASPAITTQPTNQSACVGGTATFSVTASGAGLTYQWYKNGVSLNPAGTASTYITPALVIGDNGATYYVIVSGTCTPSATSDTVTLTVNPVPGCTITAPASACAGATGLTASVPDAGVGAIYTWGITNGTIDTGTGTNSITWTAGAAGTATLSISIDNAGCSCSDSTNVTITTAPAITTQPSNQTAYVGDTATFSVVATGGGLTYQWYHKTNAAISGATGSSYTTPTLTLADDGATFYVIVDNACGVSVTSGTATLTVTEAPALTEPRHALSFDGSGDFVETGDLDLGAQGTLEAWIYITGFSDGAAILHKGGDTTGEVYSLRFGTGGQNDQLVLVINDGTTADTLTSDTDLSLSQWYHVAGIWDGANMSIYIDGVQDKTQAQTILGPQTSAQNLIIGAWDDSGTNSFNGVIDEVRVWSAALDTDIDDIRDWMCKKLIYDDPAGTGHPY